MYEVEWHTDGHRVNGDEKTAKRVREVGELMYITHCIKLRHGSEQDASAVHSCCSLFSFFWKGQSRESYKTKYIDSEWRRRGGEGIGGKRGKAGSGRNNVPSAWLFPHSNAGKLYPVCWNGWIEAGQEGVKIWLLWGCHCPSLAWTPCLSLKATKSHRKRDNVLLKKKEKKGGDGGQKTARANCFLKRWISKKVWVLWAHTTTSGHCREQEGSWEREDERERERAREKEREGVREWDTERGTHSLFCCYNGSFPHRRYC